MKCILLRFFNFYNSLRELIKLNTTNFETLIQLVFRNEIINQHNLPPQQAQAAPKNLNNNLNLLQTAFLVDGPNASKVKNSIKDALKIYHRIKYLKIPLRY
jgi:hypothetical protein